MSAGMADIIAAHSDVGVDPQSWAPGATIRWACYSCGAVEEAPSRETTKPEWHGQHLAAELTKAGYGLVQDAEAAALTDAADWFANGEAAGIIAYEGPSNRGEVTDAYDAARKTPKLGSANAPRPHAPSILPACTARLGTAWPKPGAKGTPPAMTR